MKASHSVLFFILFCGSSKTPSNHEIQWARNLVLLHAKAAGLDAIDLVQTNFNDLDVIERESREGFELGYTGKQIIHPKQIEIVQKTFAPDAKTMDWARRVMSETEKQTQLGKGAFVVDGQMVDAPLIKKAQQIIKKAKAMGL
jgi:citrate lyase subunit beta-like protein